MTFAEGKVESGKAVMETSVDRWLDERRKMDGAEGLWRIHDKLYDFTMWSRIHPGGKFWLDISRGTDITEAFETHHFSQKAESQLQNYYLREAASPRDFFTVFSENGFYKAFKRKLCQQQLVSSNELSFALTLLIDGLAVAVFLCSLLGTKHGFQWTIVCGLLLGVLSISSHSFFHRKENWRVYYFNLSLMSSREWRIRHVLGHHQYRNTNSDLEIPVWHSFSGNHTGFAKYMLNLLVFPVAAHVQFFRRILDVFLSRKLGFHHEELVAFSLPLLMFLFSGVPLWEVFVTWNLIVLVGSFVFCLLSSGFLMDEVQVKSDKNTEREEEDFGTVQLSNTGSHPKNNKSVFSFLNSFRGNVLHYLCPTVNCGSLRKLIPAFDETIDEFGIAYTKSSNGYAEGIQNRMPQGQMFFS